MKFLIDEDVSPKLVSLLQKLGHSATHIREVQISLKDSQILGIAFSGQFIVITEDKDFGELVFKESKPHTGVILLRLEDQTVENVKRVLSWFLLKYPENKIVGNFAVIEEKTGKLNVRFKKVII